MDSMALAALERSTNTTPPSSMTLPMMGVSFLISCLPIPAMSRRISLAMMTTSALLWWLKTNTAGRCDHRCSSPLTCRFMPIRALAVSANSEKEKFMDSRREPVRAYIGKPAMKLPTRELVAATDRTNCATVGLPRLPNLAIGQRLSCAIFSSLGLGFRALGWPTRSSRSRSSWLSE